MEKKRYPRKVYQMMIGTQNANYCWAMKLRDTLFDYGFHDVWMQQTVSEENAFLKEFKRRLMFRCNQNWYTTLLSSERYSLYRLYKYEYKMEQYLFDLDKTIFRDLYARFRFGVSELPVHRCRYTSDEPITPLCPSCNESYENEFHFLFLCPAYEDIRLKYLNFCYGLDMRESISACFSSHERDKIRSVASYILQAFKRRRST